MIFINGKKTKFKSLYELNEYQTKSNFRYEFISCKANKNNNIIIKARVNN